MKHISLKGLGLLPAMTLLVIFISACSKSTTYYNSMPRPSTLPDLSGLSWVADDLFIGVHDAKNNSEKKDWPRISLLKLPVSEFDGVTWNPVYLSFPGTGGLSSDLESSCSVPGGKYFLFVESGQEGPNHRRIFLACYSGGTIAITSFMDWPIAVTNVEATEVCQVGEQLYFLYAERAEGELSTKIRWAKFSTEPLSIGAFEEVEYQAVDPAGLHARPIVAIEVDTDGNIYIISTYDSGSDDGPYRSVLWQIGQIVADGQGNAEVVLGAGTRLADLDGFKAESIAVREMPDSTREIYIGTDDEHYGGIIRLISGTNGDAPAIITELDSKVSFHR